MRAARVQGKKQSDRTVELSESAIRREVNGEPRGVLWSGLHSTPRGRARFPFLFPVDLEIKVAVIAESAGETERRGTFQRPLPPCAFPRGKTLRGTHENIFIETLTNLAFLAQQNAAACS